LKFEDWPSCGVVHDLNPSSQRNLAVVVQHHLLMTKSTDEPPPPERSRSVMDYDSKADLKRAMTCGKRAEDSEGAASPVEDFDWITNNLDMSICCAQNLEEEMARLLTLKSYLILDAKREQKFERITALAGRIFDVPIALVSLVDLGRQWFMSNRGLGGRETPRSLAFCAHAIMSTQDLLVVPNASLDPRFMNNALVTSDPHIRFYAGAPLICPEGYKLGTLCIIDRKPRPMGLNLMEKQNLRELAAMVMDAMVGRKEELERVSQDQSRSIACAAHDLLTPLTSIELNLGLLLEDERLANMMDDHQRDLLHTAVGCSDLMGRICIQAIEAFRGNVVENNRKRKMQLSDGIALDGEPYVQSGMEEEEEGSVNVGRLIETLGVFIEPYPKSVPLTMEVDEDVPPVIISDDLKLFRSILNFLTNACRHTTQGSVHLRLYVNRPHPEKDDPGHLVFECEDTGPGIDVEMYPSLFVPFCGEENAKKQLRSPGLNQEFGSAHSEMNNSGLGLYSVASSIQSLGGEYGFRPRVDPDSTSPVTGSIFWFSIPIVLPSSAQENDTMSVESEDMSPQGFNEMDLNSTEQMLSQTSIGAKNGGNVREAAGPEGDDPDVSRSTKKRAIGECVATPSDVNPKIPATRTKCVLVIDDSLTIRKGIDKAFTRLGFEVTQAENGLEGLQMLKSKPYDAVLCDFLMPVMDGLDFVQQYRAWEAAHRSSFHQHIIGISAHATGSDAEMGLKRGMDKYIGKPIPLKTLKEISLSEEVQECSNKLDEEFQRANVDQWQSNLSTVPSIEQRSSRVCLIAENSPEVVKTLIQCAESRGWRASVVTDGEDALRLLKMRAWHGIFISDSIYPLTGASCVARFREWEGMNRVSRQNNIYLLGENHNASANCILPHGFDGVFGKPINPQLFLDLLNNIALTENSETEHIVVR